MEGPGNQEVDYGDAEVVCPFCEAHVPAPQFQQHLHTDHIDTFIALMSTMFPESSVTEIVRVFVTQEEEEDTYEDLLELCDTIGYHKVGIENIEEVAPIKDSLEHEMCPICISEELTTKRQIVTCGHVFCDECLSKWFKENRWCPLCKKEAQIASISRSSSPLEEEPPEVESAPSS